MRPFSPFKNVVRSLFISRVLMAHSDMPNISEYSFRPFNLETCPSLLGNFLINNFLPSVFSGGSSSLVFLIFSFFLSFFLFLSFCSTYWAISSTVAGGFFSSFLLFSFTLLFFPLFHPSLFPLPSPPFVSSLLFSLPTRKREEMRKEMLFSSLFWPLIYMLEAYFSCLLILSYLYTIERRAYWKF